MSQESEAKEAGHQLALILKKPITNPSRPDHLKAFLKAYRGKYKFTPSDWEWVKQHLVYKEMKTKNWYDALLHPTGLPPVRIP